MKRWKHVALALFLGLMALTTIRGSLAYFTAKGDAVSNPLQVGNVDITIKEDFETPDSLTVGDNTYQKAVSFANEGHVAAYARVALSFSDNNVAEISSLSSDGGKSFYSVSEFDEHLPEGWVKGEGTLAGYYYYTKPLAVGESTPDLITHVKTSFINKTADTNESINYTPRDYDIYVYAEGLQQKSLSGETLETSWQEAWQAFLEKRG